MSDPEMPQKGPYVVEVEPGTHWFCACGKSAKQPFCDGSHGGTDFTPVAFGIDEKKTVTLCGCKRSGNLPFCDGSHSKL